MSHRLDHPAVLQRVNNVLPDTGKLPLKLLTPGFDYYQVETVFDQSKKFKSPLSILLSAEQRHNELLLLCELGKLGIVHNLKGVLPDDGAQPEAEK